MEIRFTKEQQEELSKMRAKLGLNSDEEIIRNALALLAWSVTQIEDDHVVGAVSEGAQTYREFHSAALDNVAHNRAARLFTERLDTREWSKSLERSLGIDDGSPSR